MLLGDKGRQEGWSWVESGKSVHMGLDNYNTIISTRDEELGKQFVADAHEWAKVFSTIVTIDESAKEDPVVGKYVLAQLTLANGCWICVVSSNPTAIIGKRGSKGNQRTRVVLDEFDDQKDQRLLYEAAYPCATWGGQVVIYSAHYHGKQTFFNSLVNNHEKYGFSYHKVTFEAAVAQGLLDRMLEKFGKVEVAKFFSLERPIGRKTTKEEKRAYCDAIRKSVGSAAYDQAYMCKPSDEEGQFISLALYEPCERPDVLLSYEQLFGLDGQLYAGFDFARYRDLSVIWIVQHIGTQRITRHVLAMEKKDTPYQNARLAEFMAIPNMRRCCIDRTGPGIGVHDYAAAAFGSRIEGVNFTSAIKETLGFRVREYLESKDLLVPDSPVIRGDFGAIQKAVTATGNIRLDASENPENPASHCDYFWAASLALEASAGVPLGKPQVTTIGNRGDAGSRLSTINQLPGRLAGMLKGFRRN